MQTGTTREEISLVRAGDNLGWDRYEGSVQVRGDDPPTDFKAPVIDYPHELGVAVIGGYVYRGTDVPSLSGSYLYGDWIGRTIWALVPDGNGGYTTNTEVQSLRGIVSFGEDERGHCVLKLADVPEEHQAAAKQGVDNCPEQALTIES